MRERRDRRRKRKKEGEPVLLRKRKTEVVEDWRIDMRILKPGDPCPCCGQPIKEGLPMETMMLLSWLQYGRELKETMKGV